MNNIVSVIIPIYNVAKYLRKCLDSVLAQTYSDIEVVLVDDGSTDGCDIICDEYGTKDSRVHVLHNVNSGANAARQSGVAASCGDLICFVDSDDTIMPDSIECAVKLYTDNVDLVSMEEDIDSLITPTEYGGRLLHWKSVHLWGKVFRRKLLAGTDVLDVPRDFKVAEDLISNLRVLKYLSGSVVVSSLHKYNYSINGDSVAHTFKVTPEYDWKVLQEVTSAVERTALDLNEPFVHFRISILRHLICGRFPFDKVWAGQLKTDSLGMELDSMQKRVLKAIDIPIYRPVVRLIVFSNKVINHIKRML